MNSRRKSRIRRHIVQPDQRAGLDKLEERRATSKAEIQQTIAEAESHVVPDAGHDVTNHDDQKGRALTREEFVRRLQKLNPNLMYERSKEWPEFGGIYVNSYAIDALTLNPIGKIHLCGFPHDMVAEFDTRIVINERVPDPDIPLHWREVPALQEHIPGWRSTLLKLAKKGYISLGRAEVEFNIAIGRSSEKWQKAVN